jgi:hypothetical protein
MKFNGRVKQECLRPIVLQPDRLAHFVKHAAQVLVRLMMRQPSLSYWAYLISRIQKSFAQQNILIGDSDQNGGASKSLHEAIPQPSKRCHPNMITQGKQVSSLGLKVNTFHETFLNSERLTLKMKTPKTQKPSARRACCKEFGCGGLQPPRVSTDLFNLVSNFVEI